MPKNMVVCPEPLAAQAGLTVLRKGGNAVDAAIAGGFAQGVANPIMCGIGGGGTMVFHRAADNQQFALDFWGVVGSACDLEDLAARYLGQEGAVTHYHMRGQLNEFGHTAALVPGFIRGTYTAWQRFGSGRVSWGDVLEPAIRIARDGFEVYPYVYNTWKTGGGFSGTDIHSRLLANPPAAAIYTNNGHPWEIGQRVVNADYARTLERVAEEGPDVFYRGEIADAIARDFEAHGGWIRKADLEGYEPVSNPPVRGRFHGFDIVSDYGPGSGTLVVEILQAAEEYGIGDLPWNSAEYIDRLGRIINLVFADRARYMGDPRFVDVPFDRLTSREHAAEMAEKVRSDADLREPTWQPVSVDGTTHISVMDSEGNAVGMTHTLGSSSCIVTPGLGFLYNNDMHAFDPVPGDPNSLAVGKRPVNGGGPTILLRNGQAHFVIGSPAGARKVTAIAQALINVYDHGMSPQGAVTAPRFHAEDVRRKVIVEPSFPRGLINELEQLGAKVQVEAYGARLAAIQRDPTTGELEGGTDPRGARGLAELA